MLTGFWTACYPAWPLKTPLVQAFGPGITATLSETLAGPRGAALLEVSALGIPTPPGFVVTSLVGRRLEESGAYPCEVGGALRSAVAKLEGQCGRTFGRGEKLLLLGLRLSAKVMLPTFGSSVFNLGLNRALLPQLAAERGELFALEAYCRLLASFGSAVLRVQRRGESIDPFLRIRRTFLERSGPGVTQLPLPELAQVADEYERIILERTGSPMPAEPWDQLETVVRVAFTAWHSDRTKRVLRRTRVRAGEAGLALILSRMVYGNLAPGDGAGFLTTRDVSTGAPGLSGDLLEGGQPEDVSGGSSPTTAVSGGPASLEATRPELHEKLESLAALTERHFGDAQHLGFVIEAGELFIVEAKNARRSARAALRIAVDLVREGVIAKERALLLVNPDDLEAQLRPVIDPGESARVMLVQGLPASPGAASGRVAFSTEEVEARRQRGESVIFVRTETTPADVHALRLAQATLTVLGGLTSHAAVVARTLGKPCVVGARSLSIDLVQRRFTTPAGHTVQEGELITLDGSSGEVYRGELSQVEVRSAGEYHELLGWADEVRTLEVRANVDSAEDARLARELGASGVGLCRTEHMFLDDRGLRSMRALLLAESPKEREAALDEMALTQRSDFAGLLRAMSPLSVAVRLLDPPLYEFLPKSEAEVEALALSLSLTVEEIRRRRDALVERNSMLGLRGVRLGLLFPEIYEMQVRALFEAALIVAEDAVAPRLELIIPFVAFADELAEARRLVDQTAKEVLAASERGREIRYRVGAMIETPRAALTADGVAEHAEFFSFGTNDLTQMALGFSRDDSGRFVPKYLQRGILTADPFRRLDREGVGRLLTMAAELGRKTRPELEIGLCGEQAAEREGIRLALDLRLDYVSCSPYRIPGAKLAAAQLALEKKLS